MTLFFTALAVLLAGGGLPLLLHRHYRLMKALHVAMIWGGCGLGLYALYPLAQHPSLASFSCSWLQAFTLSFTLDSLSMAFLYPIFLVSPLIALYGYHYLEKPEESWRTAVSAFFFSLLLLAMILVTIAVNMLTFGLAWELMSLSSYFLVLYNYEQEETQRAGALYLLFTQTGALFIFAAFGVIFNATGSLTFAGIGQLPHGIKLLVFFLTLVGFGSKAGIFPLHIWLPHAHPAAPSHVSALLSGVMIKMGIYGILRMYLLLDDPTPIFPQTILVCGMLSGMLGVVYALGKQDLKRLLAYSSIENIGIILIGVGLGMLGIASGNRIMAAFGFAGCLLHVFNHALFKSLLFMGAGAILHKSGTRRIDQLGGLMKTMPITGRTFLAGSVAISGLPPLNGFISEFLIYYAGFQGLRLSGSTFLFSMFAIISLAIIGGLASACFTKVVGVVFLGEPRSEKSRNSSEAGPAMQSAMVLLALACLLLGAWPEPFIRLAFWSLRDLAPLAGITPEIMGSVPRNLAFAARLFLGLLLVIFILRRLLYRAKPITLSSTWGCGFTRPTARMQYTGTSYAMSMVDFFRPFIRIKTE
ncbi:MAG: hydrogenase, partial [Desulfobulbaceae bacterium]|nr:hydrogenase [Desulfobulbaceae bacterium]